MAATAAAMHFGARHAVAAIVGRLDRAGLRIVEAGPAGAAFEFPLGDKQFLITTRAAECPRAFFVIQRAASRPLGAVLAHDVKLLGRQNLAPFGVGVRDGILLGVHGWFLFLDLLLPAAP